MFRVMTLTFQGHMTCTMSMRFSMRVLLTPTGYLDPFEILSSEYIHVTSKTWWLCDVIGRVTTGVLLEPTH